MDTTQFMHKFYVDAGPVRRILLARNYLEAAILTAIHNSTCQKKQLSKHVYISERGFVTDRPDKLRLYGEHVCSSQRVLELMTEYIPPQT